MVPGAAPATRALAGRTTAPFVPALAFTGLPEGLPEIVAAIPAAVAVPTPRTTPTPPCTRPVGLAPVAVVREEETPVRVLPGPSRPVTFGRVRATVGLAIGLARGLLLVGPFLVGLLAEGPAAITRRSPAPQVEARLVTRAEVVGPEASAREVILPTANAGVPAPVAVPASIPSLAAVPTLEERRRPLVVTATCAALVVVVEVGAIAGPPTALTTAGVVGLASRATFVVDPMTQATLGQATLRAMATPVAETVVPAATRRVVGLVAAATATKVGVASQVETTQAAPTAFRRRTTAAFVATFRPPPSLVAVGNDATRRPLGLIRVHSNIQCHTWRALPRTRERAHSPSSSLPWFAVDRRVAYRLDGVLVTRRDTPRNNTAATGTYGGARRVPRPSPPLLPRPAWPLALCRGLGRASPPRQLGGRTATVTPLGGNGLGRNADTCPLPP